MSFKKIQIIDPHTINNPEQGYIYLGQDDVGLWEKDENGNIFYIQSGITNVIYVTGSTSSGTSGLNGTSGTSGKDGGIGTSGTSGKTGTNGTSGSSTSGTSGSSGTNGTSGSSGTSGTAGSSGTSGSSGSSGKDGDFYGSSGTNGTSGWSGGYGSATRCWINTSDANPDDTYFFGWNSTLSTNNLSVLEYIILNKIDIDKQNLSLWISIWNNGLLKIENREDFSNFGIYSVNTIPLPIGGNIFKIAGLTCLAANGQLVENDSYYISFISVTSGLTEDVVVAKDGGGTWILHFQNGLYIGKT